MAASTGRLGDATSTGARRRAAVAQAPAKPVVWYLRCGPRR